MEKELSYLSPEGFTVFTSHYLKNKKTCCKSACLHCPYGFTLKKHGLEFVDASEETSSLIQEILVENDHADFDWKAFEFENIKIIKIKNVVCGFLLKNHIVIKHLFLRPHFQNQDLSKEMVESYLFI
jgi:hypothetical protein